MGELSSDNATRTRMRMRLKRIVPRLALNRNPLGFRELLNCHATTHATQTTVLDATKGNLRLVEHCRVVDVNHSSFESLSQPEALFIVFRDDCRRQTEACLIGKSQSLLHVVNWQQCNNRAERFFATNLRTWASPNQDSWIVAESVMLGPA